MSISNTTSLVKIFKGSLRILKDLHEDLHEDLNKHLQGSFIFLPKSSRILHFLARIFKDPSFSCQDPQGSFIFLPRSSRIFKDLPKIMQRSSRILPKSCKDLQGSTRIFIRSFLDCLSCTHNCNAANLYFSSIVQLCQFQMLQFATTNISRH